MEREEDAIDAVNDTVAVVCYQLKNGEKRYRTYRVSQKALEAFAEVYETTEYKKIAYPLITKEKSVSYTHLTLPTKLEV